MTGILDNLFAPMTYEIGFLRCDAARAANEYHQWTTGMFGRDGIRSTLSQRSGVLRELFEMMLPLAGPERTRTMFIPTQSEWCAYFDNGISGPDPASTVGHLAGERVRCRGLRVVCTPHTIRRFGVEWRGRYGATMLTVYEPYSGRGSNELRTVGVMADGSRWEWLSHGPELAEERPATYSAKRLQDRFTLEHLDAILQRMGIRAFDESFYVANEARPAWMVELQGVKWPSQQERGLKDVQAEL